MQGTFSCKGAKEEREGGRRGNDWVRPRVGETETAVCSYWAALIGLFFSWVLMFRPIVWLWFRSTCFKFEVYLLAKIRWIFWILSFGVPSTTTRKEKKKKTLGFLEFE